MGLKRIRWGLIVGVLAGSVLGGVARAQRSSDKTESTDLGVLPAVDVKVFSSEPSSPAERTMPAEGQTISQPNEPVAPSQVSADCGACTCCPSWRERWYTGWATFKYRLHDCFLGFADEFVPRPLGASLYAFGNTHVANGEAARMVLYNYDFVENSDQLNLRGRDQLAKLMPLLSSSPFPLVIERTPNAPGLDDSRRIAVFNELGRMSVALPVERIVIGQPIALGLRGVEAEIIYSNLLLQTQSGGRGAALSGGPAPVNQTGH
jgi:hypothetical protein